jgi:hypothetical protein
MLAMVAFKTGEKMDAGATEDGADGAAELQRL